MNNPNPEEIIANDKILQIADPDGSFAYAPRTPKSASYTPSNEDRILEKLESLGASKDQVKHVLSNVFPNDGGDKNIFQDRGEEKGFFGRLLDKFKNFFGLFFN